MKTTIENLVKNYHIQVMPDGCHIRVDDTIARNSDHVAFVRANKDSIIQYIREQKKKIEEAEEASKREKYSGLFTQLPERNIKNTPDVKKFSEIMTKKTYRNFNGAEDDGLALAQVASNNAIAREAMQYCEHNLKTEYKYEMTQDARLKLVRIISCEKCGLYIRDIAEEHKEYNWN